MDESFESVYKKYYSIVYRYLVSLTKDADLAEELTQETFFKALKNIKKYDPSQKMLTWLCAIAKNSYFSTIKAKSHHTELDETQADAEGDIVDRLIESESCMEILKTVHQLEEPYKEVFTLRTLGSLSFRLIAEVFGKNENWARVTYFRSRTRIKEILNHE